MEPAQRKEYNLEILLLLCGEHVVILPHEKQWFLATHHRDQWECARPLQDPRGLTN